MSEQTPRNRVETPSALPAGARLGEFELLSVLGVGGFGIVYLAFDHALEREVAVKEYLPASLAGRTETMHVSLRSQSDAETFALGLKSFVNEARLLARFDHPSLLKVHRFWEGNGTAYMAMPVMRGRTVKEVRADMTAPPDEAWLRNLLDPLLGAIEKLHSEGVYHRDIAPDNIQIEPDGHPVLLDFGAARRVISDKSQALTAILKPAYAPIEQYAEVGSVRQGPWTDLYALGATLHYLLLGRPPPPATARAVHDDVSALTVQRLPGCSENFLAIIDWMLAPRPADRPQNVPQLRDALSGLRLPPARKVAAPEPAAPLDHTLVLPPSTLDISFDGDDTATVVVPPTGRVAAGASAQPSMSAQPVMASTAQQSIRPEATPAAASARGPAAAPAMSAPPVAGALSPQPGRKAASSLMPMLMGVGVVAAVGVAALFFWPRNEVKPSGMAEPSAALPESTISPPTMTAAPPAAQPAASAAATAPALAVVEPAHAAPDAAASVPALTHMAPESSVATVVVPPSKPAAVVPQKPAPTVAVTSGIRPPTVVQRTPLQTAPSPPVATAPVMDPPRPRSAPQYPAPATVSLPTPAPAAVAPIDASKPLAAGPEGRCSGRNPFMYFVCMERECLRSEFQEHADCRKWRKDAKRE